MQEGEDMCQLYITESKSVGYDLCEKNKVLLNNIDENIRVWIVNKNNNCLWELAIDEGRVYEPGNKKPLPEGSDVKQIIVVSKIGDDDKQELYGTTNNDTNDFVRNVLESLKEIYPRH